MRDVLDNFLTAWAIILSVSGLLIWGSLPTQVVAHAGHGSSTIQFCPSLEEVSKNLKDNYNETLKFELWNKDIPERGKLYVFFSERYGTSTLATEQIPGQVCITGAGKGYAEYINGEKVVHPYINKDEEKEANVQ